MTAAAFRPAPGTTAPPELLSALAREVAQHPLDDKILVCRPRGSGRELLHALVTHGHDWVGIRVQTPWELAVELASAGLAADELQIIDRFDELALLDDAIDTVLEQEVGAVLSPLGDAVGFRQVLAGTIRELRLAGLPPTALTGARLEDRRKGRALAAIQSSYELLLRESGRVDRADVLRRATEHLGNGDHTLPADRVYLLPGLNLRGVGGRLVRSLLDAGARVLDSDPTAGLEPPRGMLVGRSADPAGRLSYIHDVENAPPQGQPPDLFTPALDGPELEIFAAASPVDELREVLRRVVDEGLRWDQVEIVATDWRTYGTALDSVAPRLGIQVTHATGLPISRTRVGRAVAGYFQWIQEDFPDHTLRELCEANLLRPGANGAGEISGPRLARVLRGLRIGWGRDRYLQQIEWALHGLGQPPSERELRRRNPDKIEEDRQVRRREIQAVRALVEPLIEATPPTPDRLGSRRVRVAPAALAHGVRRLLRYVPDDREIDREALRRMRDVLVRIETTLRRETGFHSALAILQSLLDLRVPSPSAHGRVPWSSAGGYLHFADVEHGGLSGRPRTFVVGLDSGRFPGASAQNPLLLDGDRARLGSDELTASADLLEESRFVLAALLARLRGKVTLSYSAWDASEGRQLAPAALLLQALRLQLADPAADYQALHRQTSPIAGPVPQRKARVDAADVWLDRISVDGRLLRAQQIVRRVYPGLDRGLEALAARTSDELNEHSGAIEPRPELIDPRGNRDLLVSATGLERLARCPLQYFYRYVARIVPPEELEFEADSWLDAKQRGALLHRVYELVLVEAQRAGVSVDDEGLTSLAAKILERTIRHTRHRIPPPSQAILDKETRDLEEDLDVFLRMLREHSPRWMFTEWAFGFPGAEHAAAELTVPGGFLRLRGAVDRIDQTPAGLRIVDYKTGSRYGYGEDTGTYDGGRRLQHALYTQATEQLLESPVASAEYHFPTQKGEGKAEPYARARLDKWSEILEALLGLIEKGHFPPAEDTEKLPCKFCDYRPICRVTESYGRVVSPPVEWGKAHFHQLDEYEPLRRARSIDAS